MGPYHQIMQERSMMLQRINEIVGAEVIVGHDQTSLEIAVDGCIDVLVAYHDYPEGGFTKLQRRGMDWGWVEKKRGG